MAENNKPVSQKKAGAFATSVFLHERKNKLGGTFKVPSIVFQKSWKKDDGSWDKQSVTFFNLQEVVKARYLLDQLVEELINSKYNEEEGQ